ncbi:MAG TPA: type IV pilin [Methanocorpusculum sp.]|nr:type IV pilin [Methanocorpusculum sp.]HJK80596.1 type IV pilin [Methanocorpusculum sp.]
MCSPSSQDAAVSPTIGTILLVALTVVLVAVVAVVALGLANGMFDTKQVGLTLEPYGIASESERGVSLTVHGGADAGDLIALSASLNGPELVSRETGKSSVENPVIGTGYLFKVEETGETITSKRADKDVYLTTRHILPVPQTDYFVTVTGKFRDGTDQMLLVQRVTLPAISEQGRIYAEGGIVIDDYQFTDKGGNRYPGHGFTLQLPDSADPNKVTFEVYDKSQLKGKLSVGQGLTKSENKDANGNIVSYSYDINPAISGEKWSETPFPDTDTYWALGALSGTVTVSDENGNQVMTQGNVQISPRVNMFESPDVSGKITVDNNNKLSIKDLQGITSSNYYFTLQGSEDKIEYSNLASLKGQEKIIEAYARDDKIKTNTGGTTRLWYKVGSVNVDDLLG